MWIFFPTRYLQYQIKIILREICAVLVVFCGVVMIPFLSLLLNVHVLECMDVAVICGGWSSVFRCFVHFFSLNECLLHEFCFIVTVIINPLTARVVWAPHMISQPVSSIFLCSPLPSGARRAPGLSIPWCSLPTSSSVCLVFFPPSLCLAKWFLPDLMKWRHVHITAVCVCLRQSGGPSVVRLPAGSCSCYSCFLFCVIFLLFSVKWHFPNWHLLFRKSLMLFTLFLPLQTDIFKNNT